MIPNKQADPQEEIEALKESYRLLEAENMILRGQLADAKKEAIAFSEWNCRALWSVYEGRWYPYMDEDNPISGEELYDLWIKSQSNTSTNK